HRAGDDRGPPPRPRPRAPLRWRRGLDRRDDSPHGAGAPDRDLRPGQPAHPPSSGRVRRDTGTLRCRKDLRGLGAEVPRGVVAPPERPRLRALEAFPIQQDGQRAVGLRDPARFTDQVAVLPVPLLDIVSLFDGEHSLDEIRDSVSGRHGLALTRAEIGAVAERLDEGGFLDSPRFAARRERIEAEYAASPARPAAHAGGAYAGEPDALRAQIDAFFRSPIGPGMEAEVGSGFGLRGLLAPHIDFHRGGPTYAWAYRELLRRSDAACFVILGTCHAGMSDPFAATLKAYDTPLGPAPVDHDVLDALGRRYGHDLFGSEGAHRVEHSIEFQAVMLRWALADRRPFTVVPVLAC